MLHVASGRALRFRKKASSQVPSQSPTKLIEPWWLSPVGLVVGFLLPVLLLIAQLDQLGSADLLTIRGVRFLQAQHIWLAAGILGAISLAAWVGMHIVPRTVSVVSSERIHRSAVFLGWLLIFVYLFSLRDALLSPTNLLSVLHGMRFGRTQGRVAGVTSLQNIGPVFFSLVGYLSFIRVSKMSRHLKFLTASVAGLTLLRSYLWSERVAFIEITLPFALCWLVVAGGRFNYIKRLARLFGPYGGIPLLILFFALSEYFRSWQSATYFQRTGFLEFAAGRFASYYYTSLNNGALLLSINHEPTYALDTVLYWLHKFPLGLGTTFQHIMNVSAKSDWDDYLLRYADPEFNNPSGIFSVVNDIGLPLAIAYFSMIGFAAGIAYRRLIAGALDGVLLYPLFVMSFLELYRYAYLGSSRAFPWMLAILLTSVYIYYRRPVEPSGKRSIIES